VSFGATERMVGPRRTGGDEAEAAGGDLYASKHASAGVGWGGRARRRTSWMPLVSRSVKGEEACKQACLWLVCVSVWFNGSDHFLQCSRETCARLPRPQGAHGEVWLAWGVV